MSKRIAYGSNLIGVDSGGSSGGHTIWNAIKTALTQRSKLWFADANVTDDSTDGATKVEVLQDGMSAADFDAASDLQDGVYPTYNESPVRITDTMIKNTVSGRGNTVAEAVTDTVSKTNGGTFNGNVTVDHGDSSLTSSQESQLIAGNNIPEGTAGSAWGSLRIFGKDAFRARLMARNLTNHRDFEFPDKAGTIFLQEGGTFTGNINVDRGDSSVSTARVSQLALGNNIASGTAGNSFGQIALWDKGSHYSVLATQSNNTGDRTILLPDASGTLALTSDIAKTQQDYSDVSVAANSSTWVANVRTTTESLANITAWVDNSNCIAYIARANQSLQLYVRNFSSSAVTVNVTVVIS